MTAPIAIAGPPGDHKEGVAANLCRVRGVIPTVDLARRQGLRIAVAAFTLLFTLGAFDQLKTPALPMPERAVASVEEIAERLRGHVDDDVTYAPYVTTPGIPLLPWCWPETIDARLPPEGVPAYSGELLFPEMDEPLKARFWITSPEEAARGVAAARRGTEECGHSDDDKLKDVTDFERWGWRGVQTLVTSEYWTEHGDSGAGATIVAARGGLLAEVTWAWPFEPGGEPDRRPLLRGAVTAASVLAAVGGDRTGPAPAAATTRSAAAEIAAALPPPSAYGRNMTAWTSPGNMLRSHELTCGDSSHEQIAYDGAPGVTRRLIGEVSVREDVLFLPDEQTAEQARAQPLRWDGGGLPTDEGEIVPCHADSGMLFSIEPALQPFDRGPWKGEIRTLAISRPDPPRRTDLLGRPTPPDEVAHVAVGVRHGTTMVHLRWQGPAGTDPAAALRAGRAALTRTLDRLPAGG
ncbi:hypothetical protein [Nonomuraea sp. B5E05]|uniref:hypothetical protein n=1 Tax=Nonomuraea sp. B5E05 TaxID=3153569 RepID=UPI00325FEAB6